MPLTARSPARRPGVGPRRLGSPLRRSVAAMAGPDSGHLAGMRVEYGSAEKDGSADLDADWLDDGWLVLLRKWIADAERAGVAEPNAMVLATVRRREGRSAASVLCKSVDESGITFFTNYDSAKGAELAATPYASATFPVVRARPAGPRAGRGDQGQPRAHRRLLVQAARAAPSSVRGRRTSRSRSHPARRCSTSSPTSPRGSPTPKPCRCRRTGAAT